MYIDPNTAGMSFQTFAATLAALTGLLLILSQQARPQVARIRLRIHNPKREAVSTQRDIVRT